MSIHEFVQRTPQFKTKFLIDNEHKCFNGWIQIDSASMHCRDYQALFADGYYRGTEKVARADGKYAIVCLGQDQYLKILDKYGSEKGGKARLCLTFFQESGPPYGPLNTDGNLSFEWE